MEYINALQYLKQEWKYTDIGERTIQSVISESDFTLINMKDDDTYYYSDRDALLTVSDKSMTISAYCASISGGLPPLEKEVELTSSKYVDVSAERMGMDYAISREIPFLISHSGIDPVDGNIVRGIHNRLVGLGDFNIGTFDVGLSHKVHNLTLNDISTKRFTIKANFKLNNSFLVFGDSLIKLSRIMVDNGDGYSLKDSWRNWLVDLYIDNIDCIPPTSIGVQEHSIRKSQLTSLETMRQIFTHHKVFIVEYLNYFPLGEYEIKVENEFVDDYYEDLVMYRNRPTTAKVINLRLGYALKDLIVPETIRQYKDNSTILLASKDEIMVKRTPHLYGVDYPLITFKK